MKKLYFFLILIVISSKALNAQEKISYKSNNQNIKFKISTTEFYITYNLEGKNELRSRDW